MKLTVGQPTVVLAMLVLLQSVLIQGASEEYTISYNPKVVIRAPRSIGNFIKRMFTRSGGKTGFQGTSMASGPYAGSASSYYPSYASAYPYPSPYASSPYAPASPMVSSYPAGGYATAASYPSYSYAPYPSGPGPMSSPLMASASAPSGYTTSGYQPSNPDFHAVLDSLVRSAGLSPTGAHDQEAAASSIQSKGDTPVFSFKKLYSFPFYLNNENGPQESGFNLQIPYLKRHIRRMSSGAAANGDLERQKHVQALAYQQQMIRSMAQSDMLTGYIQQYLRERAEREAAEGSAQAMAEFRRKVQAFQERQREAYERRDDQRDGQGQVTGGGQPNVRNRPGQIGLGQQQSSAVAGYETVSDMDSGEESLAESQYRPKFSSAPLPPSLSTTGNGGYSGSYTGDVQPGPIISARSDVGISHDVLPASTSAIDQPSADESSSGLSRATGGANGIGFASAATGYGSGPINGLHYYPTSGQSSPTATDQQQSSVQVGPGSGYFGVLGSGREQPTGSA